VGAHHLTFLVPGDLGTPTGGFTYDRRLVNGLRDRGWTVNVRQVEGGPRPDEQARARADGVLAALPAGTLVLADGLAIGGMPSIVERHASRLALVPIVHLPLAAEIGLTPSDSAALAEAERRVLAASALVVVTGHGTPHLLAEFGVMPAGQLPPVVVVEPGTDLPETPAPRPERAGTHTVHLLTVATLNAGKGHDVLLEALARVSPASWHLTCAGSLTRDTETARRVSALVETLDLRQRVNFTGELAPASLATRYAEADVFVLASLRETYGMAVAEAIAHGVPVVATRTGAIPRLVGNDAGVVVPCGDVEALAAALARLLGDRTERIRFGTGAVRARQRLAAWPDQVQLLETLLEQHVLGHPVPSPRYQRDGA